MLTFLACFFIIFLFLLLQKLVLKCSACVHMYAKGSFQYITQFVHSSKNVDITLYQNQMPNCTSLAILHSMFFLGNKRSHLHSEVHMFLLYFDTFQPHRFNIKGTYKGQRNIINSSVNSRLNVAFSFKAYKL